MLFRMQAVQARMAAILSTDYHTYIGSLYFPLSITHTWARTDWPDKATYASKYFLAYVYLLQGHEPSCIVH